MTLYRAQHADLFRTVAYILVRDYIAPSETAETVAEWAQNCGDILVAETEQSSVEIEKEVLLMKPSELAALIADVEGYEKR